jgi:hypothetical protein
VAKVAGGVNAIEDTDGLPVALATALDNGTPLQVTEQWWGLHRRLCEWAASDEARELLKRAGEADE